MKLIHLSDLHLGKRVNEFSLLEDQRHVLAQILRIAAQERPDAVLIAGDVYDKTVPSVEAVRSLDGFLVDLVGLCPAVLLISGNHDSPERMAFGGRLMAGSGVHLAPVYDGTLVPHTLWDEHGPVDFYLLPFLKPAAVRRFFPDRTIEDHNDAVAAALDGVPVDPARRNVLVAHQLVTGASRCDSEEISVGGLDGVDVSVFDGFDYVALGHLHGPQRVGRETVRYCGTPLKYSFSEARHHKSVTVVELGEKGAVAVRTVPLVPLRDMVELRGTYEELTRRDVCARAAGDYVHLTLTDEEDVPDAVRKLRIFYPWLMKLDYDNARTRAGRLLEEEEAAVRRSPLELLEEFYARQNGRPMGEEQRALVRGWIGEIWEGEI